jgi:prephenate dehydrogenase
VVVGVGLIGGSFAAALRQVGQVGKVIGVGRQVASLERARDLGLIDEFLPLDQAVAQADLVLLSVPVGATEATLAALLPHLPEHAVVTDVGSTKREWWPLRGPQWATVSINSCRAIRSRVANKAAPTRRRLACTRAAT